MRIACLTSAFLRNWKSHLFRSIQQFLDASHNNISEMSVCDFHTHWAHSLTNLNLSYNDFTEIPDTVCQLTLLNSLDISRNNISHMPSENLWTTRHLIKLNLSYNKLSCNNEDSSKSYVKYEFKYKELRFILLSCNLTFYTLIVQFDDITMS